MEGVAKGSWTISDALWGQMVPLLPPERPKPTGGRPRMPDRPAMEAIFYVLRTGCQWKALPRALGAGSTIAFKSGCEPACSSACGRQA